MQEGVIANTPYDTPLANDTFDLDFAPLNPPLAPVDSDADGMPDAFELRYAVYGLNPNLADNNGTSLSLPLTGVAGYSNLEVYLNLLADRFTGALFADGFE